MTIAATFDITATLANRMRPKTMAKLAISAMNPATIAVVTETIFSWPGIGRYVVNAIARRDLPAIQGSVLFLSAVFVLVNLLTDLAYAKADPRVTYS